MELGAEFVHGRPPGLCSILKAAGLPLFEASEQRWRKEGASFKAFPEFWETIEKVDGQIPAGPEISYVQFLDHAQASPSEKSIARAFVEGFNAAQAERISAQAVALADRAAEEIEGEKAFRVTAGYGALVDWLRAGQPENELRFETAVERIAWNGEGVEVRCRTPGGIRNHAAECVVITVPLGVLKSRQIEFAPELPKDKLEALMHLEMGAVQRFVLEFDDVLLSSRNMPEGFVMADGLDVPVWWRTTPAPRNLLVGWTGGPLALKLGELSGEQRRECVVESLSKMLDVRIEDLRRHLIEVHHHDWMADPWSRGAYSYPGIAGIEAARMLAQPIEGRLYFAGEATDFSGHSGTVHGALESGLRVAREINSP